VARLPKAKPGDLLSSDFFVSLSVVSQKLVLERYDIKEWSYVSKQLPRDTISDLYAVTRDFLVWGSFVFRVTKSKNPFTNTAECAKFISANSFIKISSVLLDKVLQLRSSVTSDTPRLKEIILEPKITATNVYNYHNCYSCCYDDSPKGCRNRFDHDSDNCFTKCIDKNKENNKLK